MKKLILFSVIVFFVATLLSGCEERRSWQIEHGNHYVLDPVYSCTFDKD